jgi:hypothetical protein
MWPKTELTFNIMLIHAINQSSVMRYLWTKYLDDYFILYGRFEDLVSLTS